MDEENFVELPDISADEIVAAASRLFPMEMRLVISELRSSKMADLLIEERKQRTSHLSVVSEAPNEEQPDGVAE